MYLCIWCLYINAVGFGEKEKINKKEPEYLVLNKHSNTIEVITNVEN